MSVMSVRHLLIGAKWNTYRRPRDSTQLQESKQWAHNRC